MPSERWCVTSVVTRGAAGKIEGPIRERRTEVSPQSRSLIWVVSRLSSQASTVATSAQIAGILDLLVPNHHGSQFTDHQGVAHAESRSVSSSAARVAENPTERAQAAGTTIESRVHAYRDSLRPVAVTCERRKTKATMVENAFFPLL